MHVVAVVNTKGGVGKTTLSASLAVRAAQESKRVAMVDMDPQKSLVEWWARRGRSENPTIFEGAATARDAVEALALNGYDWVFVDGPPAFLSLIQEIIEVATFVLIPVKPSMVDLLATQDAVSLARDAHATHLAVVNDVGPRERAAETARDFLFSVGVPIAETQIVHRISHIAAMTVGKSAAEVNKGKDKAATNEIDALWKEVKAGAQAAQRTKLRRAANE
jgi:chromosome partitioning protein